MKINPCEPLALNIMMKHHKNKHSQIQMKNVHIHKGVMLQYALGHAILVVFNYIHHDSFHWLLARTILSPTFLNVGL